MNLPHRRIAACVDDSDGAMDALGGFSAHVAGHAPRHVLLVHPSAAAEAADARAGVAADPAEPAPAG
jgi:hypothetical protein